MAIEYNKVKAKWAVYFRDRGIRPSVLLKMFGDAIKPEQIKRMKTLYSMGRATFTQKDLDKWQQIVNEYEKKTVNG